MSIKFQSLNIKTRFRIFRHFVKLFIYTDIPLLIFENNASSFLYNLACNYNLFAARQLRKSRFFLLSRHRRAICIFNYNKKHREPFHKSHEYENRRTGAIFFAEYKFSRILSPFKKGGEICAYKNYTREEYTVFLVYTQYFLPCYSFARIYRVFLQDGDLCAHWLFCKSPAVMRIFSLSIYLKKRNVT